MTADARQFQATVIISTTTMHTPACLMELPAGVGG
jgi:hypothetical protein